MRGATTARLTAVATTVVVAGFGCREDADAKAQQDHTATSEIVPVPSHDSGVGATRAATAPRARPRSSVDEPQGARADRQSPCPSDMQLVATACVDRYEAHLVRVGADGSTARHSPFLRPADGQHYAARSAPGVKPQAYINRNEARSACEAAGKRLCTIREWYRACTGSTGTVYPYGSRFVAGRCNTGKPHLLSTLFGNDPRSWKYDEHFNSPRLNQEPGFLAATGAHRECASDAGTYDMVGNLHEWVSDSVNYDLPKKIPLRDDIRAKIGVNYGKAIFMGGFYSTTGEHGQGCKFLTPGHGWKYHDYSTGFRCCRDPQGALLSH
jgi:sulfatase modifying factor 1